MFDPESILDPLFTEVSRLLAEMKKTKDLEKRRIQSEIIKNLCESLGVFFDTMTNAMTGDLPDFMEDYDDDEEVF